MSASGHPTRRAGFRFVVVVASLGGLPVLSTVLAGLPEGFEVPVLIVQHRTAQRHGDGLALLLQRHTVLPVRNGQTGLPAWAPGVTVIPGGWSATIDSGASLALQRSTAGDLGGDALLISAAGAALPAAGIGVVLSGRLHDGSQGVRAVKMLGGRVLAQDPETARATGMPSGAMATGCVDFVLPPHRIAPALVALTMAPGGADLLAVPMAGRGLAGLAAT